VASLRNPILQINDPNEEPTKKKESVVDQLPQGSPNSKNGPQAYQYQSSYHDAYNRALRE